MKINPENYGTLEDCIIAGGLIMAILIAMGTLAWKVHHQQKPCACIQPEPQPFCQVMGSPVGGRMAQLPEGYGPHD